VPREMNVIPIIAMAGLGEMREELLLVAGYFSLVPLTVGLVAIAVWPRRMTLLLSGCIASVSAVLSRPWMAIMKIDSPDLDVMFYADKFTRLGRVWIAVFLASIVIMTILFGIRRLYAR
jgi:hypothetical protein